MSRGRFRGEGRVWPAGLGLLLCQPVVPSWQQRGCCRGEKAPWLWSAPSTVPSMAVASSIHGPVPGCGQLHPRFSPGLFHLHREKPKVLRRGQRSLYSGADAPEGRVACIASSRAGPFMRYPPSLSVTCASLSSDLVSPHVWEVAVNSSGTKGTETPVSRAEIPGKALIGPDRIT